MGHRFAADKEEEADTVFDADIDRVIGLLERDAFAGFGVEAIDGEAAEIAVGIADVGDGELEVARAATAQALPEQRPEAGLAYLGRLRRIDVGALGALLGWGWFIHRLIAPCSAPGLGVVVYFICSAVGRTSFQRVWLAALARVSRW